MTFYVLQIRAHKIQQYLEMARRQLGDDSLKLWWPRRALKIRKAGSWQDTLSPIFPGYLFLEIDDISFDIYNICRKIPGFIRFLNDNQHITPLSGRDKEILLHFLNLGDVVGSSKVVFDENQKVRIVSGPLKGLEGCIAKVNRRKKRIKIKLKLYQESFYVDFSFESIEKIKEEAK